MGKKENLLLVGGGGHCRSVIDVIEQEGKYQIAGIVDIKKKIGERMLGYNIIACDDDLPQLANEYCNFHITLGFIKSSEKRKMIFSKLSSLNVNFPIIISPKAYVSKHATIGKGTIIMHFAQVNSGARIGDNAIINSKALIEHDTLVGDNCHISTGAILNGNVSVGDNSFVGSGAIIVHGINVQESSFIKAAKLVLNKK